MSKTRRLRFRFSDKHKEYIRATRDHIINVAEGAVRAGKTVDNVFAFAAALDETPDRIHLATGSTVANAKLNIGDCNGMGLEAQFRGRCKWGKYRDNDCIFVDAKRYGQKIVIFAGGAKADSFKRIRGNSYGMWIATEINLHHDNTIKEAFNRQLAAQYRRVFWDLNPGNPTSDIYTKYLDVYAGKQAAGTMIGGYNYAHFTIRDNQTISEERFAEIVSQYDPESVWYRRDILGERCSAEGLIYRRFADDPSHWCVKPMQDDLDGCFISIGVDFGGNRSLTTFVATAIRYDYSRLFVLKDHHIQGAKGEIDPDRVNREFLAFVGALKKAYPGIPVRYCWADSEAQYLINGLRKACRSVMPELQIGDSAKHAITQRIACTQSLLTQDRMSIHPDCKLVIGGLSAAVWDADHPDKDVRLDNFSTDIDILDAFEYSWERFMPKLLPHTGKGR